MLVQFRICYLVCQQMIVRCQHQVYLQPKMFQTIGFHHQGIYTITAQLYSHPNQHATKNYAYPILYREKSNISIKLSVQENIVHAQRSQYETHRFDISFNEQEFVFNGGCRFLIQTEQTKFQNENNNKNRAAANNKDLFLVMKLVKHNKISQEKKESKEKVNDRSKSGDKGEVGMQSTQNIIKQSQMQVSEPKKQIKEKNKKNKKPLKKQQQVSQVIVKIDTTADVISSTKNIYQTVTFSQQQYFGKLFYMINYVKIGYKIRPHAYSINRYGRSYNNQATNSRMSQFQGSKMSRVMQNKSIKSIKSNSKIIEMSANQLYQYLSTRYGNVCKYYKLFIREQIQQLNRIIQISKELSKFMDRTSINLRIQHSKSIHTQNMLNNQNKINLTASDSLVPNLVARNPLQWSTKSLTNLSINVPDESVYSSWKNLCSYYECQSNEQLYITIYNQNLSISQYITHKWHQVLAYMSRQKWTASYFHKTLINFKQQTQYIKNNCIFDGLRSFKQYNEFIPKLKYRYHIHEGIPFLFTKKTINNQKLVVETSPQHILFILVHGFNGNQHDMNRIKSFVGFFSTPHLLVLKKISNKSLETLDVIGKTAAQEISEYLTARPYITRINFIGFSLGGVIIRACLPYLKQFHPYFNILITLSSPHLGVRQISNCLVKTGMQVLHRVRGIKNIKQLLLDSKQDELKFQQKNGLANSKQYISLQQTTYLQKLAKDPSINVFNLVVVCGADEDKYVPGFSAALDYRGQNPKIINMMKNLKANIKNLHQIYVKFNPKKQGSFWDRVSGRRIHINFLDDDPFLHFFFAQYYHVF